MHYSSLALLAFSLAASSASAADFVMIGQPGKISETFIGCRSNDSLQTFKGFVRAHDKEAGNNFLMAHLGECQFLQQGTAGTVEDLSAWTASTCLRRPGEQVCLWVPTEYVVAP